MGKPVFNPYGMDPGFRYTDTPDDERKQPKLLCPKCQAAIPGGSSQCPVCHENVEELLKAAEKEETRTKKIRRTDTIVIAAIVCILLVACIVFFSRVPA